MVNEHSDFQFEIRRAQPTHARSLTDLSTRTFVDTFAKDNSESDMNLFLNSNFSEEIQAREIADPKRTILIAWQNKKAIGYLHLVQGDPDPSVTGPKPIEILRLYVDEFAQGKGVAAALLESALKLSRELGYETVWLGVWEKNFKAQAFYRKWGFKEVGSHVFQLGTDAQKDLIWEREL